MPSFCKVVEKTVSSCSEHFCLQIQKTAAFDKLQVTILLLSRLRLGENNQLDNKSVRGFAYFITSFILSVLLFCQETKTWRTTSQLLFALTHTNQERWVSEGCHELHPLPLLSFGRSLCSFFLTSGYSSGRASKEGIFFSELLHCFLFYISKKEKKLSNNIEFWLTECYVFFSHRFYYLPPSLPLIYLFHCVKSSSSTRLNSWGIIYCTIHTQTHPLPKSLFSGFS